MAERPLLRRVKERHLGRWALAYLAPDSVQSGVSHSDGRVVFLVGGGL